MTSSLEGIVRLAHSLPDPGLPSCLTCSTAITICSTGLGLGVDARVEQGVKLNILVGPLGESPLRGPHANAEQGISGSQVVEDDNG
jgi:hypothetical protein